MLQTPKYQKDQVVSFKIVNGDEVVAKVVEETDTAYLVSKPCTVVPSAQGLGLLQSLYTGNVNDTIALDKKHVMLHAPTVKEIEGHYIATTTGIEQVSAGGIIT